MLNSPRAMLERLVYLCWLVETGASVVAVIFAAFQAFHEPALLTFLLGVSGLGLSLIVYRHGERCWHFKECADSLEFVRVPLGAVCPDHVRRAISLRKVLDDWEELEGHGEICGDDVWRRHELRQQARSLLAEDPDLRQEFKPELARRPELGDW